MAELPDTPATLLAKLAAETTGESELSWIRFFDLGPRGRFEFVKCPAGEVKMAIVSNYKTRKVKISRDFWIMKKTLGIQSRNPVEGQANQLTSLCEGELPKGYVVRLPTLAEWEYAWHANTRDKRGPYFDIFALSGSGEQSYDKIMGASESDRYSTAKENAWGIVFTDCEQCFDRFPLCEPHQTNEIKMPAGDVDVFSWVDNEEPYAFASRHVRFNAWIINRSDKANYNNMRFVIAPDLLAERNAQK